MCGISKKEVNVKVNVEPIRDHYMLNYVWVRERDRDPKRALVTFDFGNKLLLPFQIKQMREIVVEKRWARAQRHNRTIYDAVVHLYEHRIINRYFRKWRKQWIFVKWQC